MDFSCKPLEQCYLKKLNEWFPVHVHSHEFNPGTYVMPQKYSNILQDLLDFEVRKDDVWVLSHPRTGSTWCQEIVWLLWNDLNFDLARSKMQLERAPPIELSGIKQGKWDHDFITPQYVHNLPSPRCVKSHSPYDLLPKQMKTIKPKIIYITRNPKDVWCSWYYFLQTFYGMEAPFEEAAEFFCKGKMPFGGFFENCLPYWKRRHEPNILFLKYEDVLSDTKKAITDIANFLEKPLTEEQLDKLHDFVLFENMKGQQGVKPFLRSGKSGDWKNHMSAEISEMFDEWIARNTKGTNLTFTCD